MKNQKTKFILALLLSSALLLISCGTTKSAAYAKMYGEKPLVMLMMPPINNTNSAEAKDFFYTTLNVPLAEAGYYVLPPSATMATLQKESAYDAELFINGDLSKFGQIFGADVAVFTIIKQWDKTLIANRMVVEVEYVFKSTKTNEILFNRNAEINYYFTSATMGSSSLVGTLVGAVVDTLDAALTDYYTIAVRCNNESLADLPYGKYQTRFGQDGEDPALSNKIHLDIHK
ncbi:MAG: DUF799 domain-containing protein [Treponema sp.]|nr:DUF799 domain-containing protein [Treponema sp.]